MILAYYMQKKLKLTFNEVLKYHNLLFFQVCIFIKLTKISMILQKRKLKPSELLKADKDGIIYTITNPLGEVYIGKTKKDINKRLIRHVNESNSNSKKDNWIKLLKNNGLKPLISIIKFRCSFL